MRSLIPCLAFATLTAGCITGGGDPGSGRGPQEWPEGIFVLEGTVQYAQASGFGRRTITQVYEAEISIASGEQMRLRSSAGMCREPEPALIRTQLARGFRTFSCGSAHYELRPSGSSVQGSLSVTVSTVRREREGCLRRSEDGKTCLEYSYNLREGTERVTTSLRVRPKD